MSRKLGLLVSKYKIYILVFSKGRANAPGPSQSNGFSLSSNWLFKKNYEIYLITSGTLATSQLLQNELSDAENSSEK
jgi:hypothetical protein